MKFPNLRNAIATALRTAWATLRGYEILASAETEQQRKVQCEYCFFLLSSRQCDICTCFIDAKVLLNPESCPVGKWPAVWQKKLTKTPFSGT